MNKSSAQTLPVVNKFFVVKTLLVVWTILIVIFKNSKASTFFFVGAAVKKVNMGSCNLKTTFDDIHYSDQLHIFWDD